MKQIIRLIFFIVIVALTISCNNNRTSKYDGWQVAHGNSDGNHYSSLTEIDTTNVNHLQVAWTYHTGDADSAFHTQIQCNPIVVDGVLFGLTPKMKLFAKILA